MHVYIITYDIHMQGCGEMPNDGKGSAGGSKKRRHETMMQ